MIVYVCMFIYGLCMFMHVCFPFFGFYIVLLFVNVVVVSLLFILAAFSETRSDGRSC